MCIRDSAYSYDDTMSLKALKDLEGQKLQDLKEIVEELRDADGRLTVVYAMYKAVSYTHLDVYKRQAGTDAIYHAVSYCSVCADFRNWRCI